MALSVLLVAGIYVRCLAVVTAPIDTASLQAQSIQAALAQRWPESSNHRISWLVIDVPSGFVLAQRGMNPEVAIPVGSLTKPILALAYSRTHATFPLVFCRGRRDRCWLPRGHGSLGIIGAIARSCNAYFLNIAEHTDREALQEVLLQLGLPLPPLGATPAELIGLEPGWTISPNALVRAYSGLVVLPEAGTIVAGLQAAAMKGSANALRAEDVLAKTGTAPCRGRSCVASADGLVIAMRPAEHPRIVLFVRQEGSTGAATAALAAEMLRLLEVPRGR